MVRRMTAHDSAEAAFICIASGGERPEDRCEGETTETRASASWVGAEGH